MTTMTTPGGDLIEVVSDEDFLAVYEVNPIDLRIWGPKEPVLAALWFHGKFHSPSGRATQQIHLEARRYGYKAAQSGLVGLFGGSTFQGAIERDINGKRTYTIKLVRLPESYVKRLQLLRRRGVAPLAKLSDAVSLPEPSEQPDDQAPDVGEAEPQPDEGQDAAEGSEGTEHVEQPAMPDLTPDVAELVAQHLLAEVIRIVTAPPKVVEVAPEGPSPELIEARDRLARSLEYTQRLRKELQEASNKLAHMTAERDGLANKLAVNEAQLQRALGVEGRSLINDEVRRQLANIMERGPGSAKGADDAG